MPGRCASTTSSRDRSRASPTRSTCRPQPADWRPRRLPGRALGRSLAKPASHRETDALMTNRVRKAVFPVAGLGTRLLPATKSIAKEMVTIVDRPLIQYAVDEAREAGIEQLIF